MSLAFHLIRTLKGFGALRSLLFSTIVLMLVAGIIFFAIRIQSEFRQLSVTASDSIQWNMSQAEVEHLLLTLAMSQATREPEPDLDQLRQYYNFFYSRITTLEEGELYMPMRESQKVDVNLAKIRGFLDDTVSYIDGPDEQLIAALPQLIDRAWDLRQDVRAIGLVGISFYATLHDARSQNLSNTLNTIAILTALLLLLLLTLVFALARLNKINRLHAREISLTNSRLSAVIATSLDAIVVIDPDGNILKFNQAAERIFGYSRDEAIGKNLLRLIVPDNRQEEYERRLIHSLRLGKVSSFTDKRARTEGRRKNGEVFPVELSVDIAPGSAAQVLVAFMRDISKEVEAEAALRAARDSAIAGEKSKAQLLAVMSHEMRTPLNGLLGTMELLQGTPLTEQQARYLKLMDRSGNLLLRHVNDVLDISRLDAGKVELDRTFFDLNHLIAELIESQSYLAQRSGNKIRFLPGNPTAEPVFADQLRLRQILLNLIGNAVKFTRNGDITVETARLSDGRTIEITVADTGVGISGDDLGRIFDDFTTLDSSYARRADGSGLGLGIAHRMARAMQGEIGVESELGEGSLFWVRLPVGVSLQEAAQSEAQDPGPQPGAMVEFDDIEPLDILLVEDNEINRMVACEFLTGDGHRVTEAADGSAGISMAARQRFDLIFLDISMPDLDGTAVAHAVRASAGPSHDTPIIAITAHAMKNDIERFRAAGMREVIIKPITRNGLRKVIAKEISHRQPGALVNAATLSSFRSEIGEEAFKQFLGQFLSQTDTELAALRAHVETDGNPEDAARMAHRLAGSAAIFGAQELRDALVQIEKDVQAGAFDLLRPKLEEITGIWASTRELLTGSA